MKFRIAMLTAVVALAMAGSAQAACRTSCLTHRVSTLSHRLSSEANQISSLDAKINSLTSLVGALSTTVSTGLGSVNSQVGTLNSAFTNLTGCLKEAPITDYGDPSSGTFGYVYDTGGGSYFDTTALDASGSGSSISGWIMLDGCNTTTVAPSGVHASSAHSATASGAVAKTTALHEVARKAKR